MNSTNSSNINKTQHPAKCRLSIRTFDTNYEDLANTIPPVITRAQQTKLTKDSTAKLKNLGFSFGCLSPNLNDTKTFCSIFCFCYSKIDPKFKASKRWEEEYIKCLRNIKYPYLIKRNDLYELSNSNSWPYILNSLHFLICAATFLQGFALETEFFESFEANEEHFVKIKWDFILGSLNPNNKENALYKLQEELRKIQEGFNRPYDLNQLELLIDQAKDKTSEYDLKKTESEQLEKNNILLRAEISKLQERYASMTKHIEIFKEKNTKINEEIDKENKIKQNLKNELSDITEIVNNQAMNTASMTQLSEKMQITKKRIIELTNNCESTKSEISKIENKTRRNNFLVQDELNNLSSKIAHLRTEIDRFDKIIKIPNFDFSLPKWKQEQTSLEFKEMMNNLKKQLNEHLNSLFINKSQLEKNIIEKKVDLMNLNDEQNKLAKKEREIENQLKLSEKNANNPLFDASFIHEDSLLKIANNKFELEKEIFQLESEFKDLEKKMKEKQEIKIKNDENLRLEYEECVKNFDIKIESLKKKILEKSAKAKVFERNIVDIFNLDRNEYLEN